MAVYTNDLRLTELATGEGSGTWGVTTNTSLSLIGEAFSFGTEAITTNADTHTTTIADGASDPGRSLFLKYTGTLDSTCTITIGPNTVSKLWFIENATSGSQSIIIKQGSGATVTIANGQTKAIYSDGAGSGGAMVDAFQDLSVPDLFIDDDLTVGDDLVFSSDSAVISFGADGDTTLTHTDGSGLTLNSTNKIMFNDASQFIQGSSATVLSLGATDEIDLTATAIDVNGTMDVSGALTGTTATFTTADNLAALTVISTDADASVGPLINFQRDSGSPADSDVLGRLQFLGKNDASEDVTYAAIDTIIEDASDGTEDAQFRFRSITAGTVRSRMEFTGTETVFNEASVDLDFRVESDSNTHMLFVDAGNNRVGIGTSSPSAPLDIVSSATGGTTLELDNTSTGGRNYTLYSSGSGNSFGAGNFALYDADAAAVRLLVDSSGNVGIGTSSPSDVLHAVGPTINLERQSNGAGFGVGLKFSLGDSASTTANHNYASIFGVIEDNTNGAEDGYLSFQTSLGGSVGERMRIDSSGNVGIGQAPSTFTNYRILELKGGTAGAMLNFENSASTRVSSFVYDDSNDLLRIQNFLANPITFETDDTERMRIDSSGNLGLGLTPNTWSVGRALELGFEGNALWGNAADEVIVVQNAYYNSGWKYATTRPATHYSQYNGGHRWFTSPSGTADAALTWAERMNIDASGNVGIGSTVFSSARVNSTHLVVGTGTNSPGITLYSDLNSQGSLNFGDAASGTDSYDGGLVYAFGSGSPFLSFHVNGGTERLRIDSSGKLLLATSNTGGTFSVERNGNTYNISAVSDANNTSEGYFRGYSTGAGADRVIIYSNGNIVNAGNSYGALSDLKLKENIVDSGSQWDDVKSVRVRKYSMKLDQVAEANQLGVIAQELESSGMTNLVYESIDRDIDGNDLGTTTKQVKYSILYMKAVKALQEAMDRIETLEAKVQQLENN